MNCALGDGRAARLSTSANDKFDAALKLDHRDKAGQPREVSHPSLSRYPPVRAASESA